MHSLVTPLSLMQISTSTSEKKFNRQRPKTEQTQLPSQHPVVPLLMTSKKKRRRRRRKRVRKRRRKKRRLPRMIAN